MNRLGLQVKDSAVCGITTPEVGSSLRTRSGTTGMITIPLGAIINGAILMRIGVANLVIMIATAVEFVVCVKGGLVLSQLALGNRWLIVEFTVSTGQPVAYL